MTLSISQHPETSQQATVAIPHWDAMYRELRVGQCVVKVYKVPSQNQEAVLEAFQEEGWPHRIYDPLAPQADTEPKCRLHDTIKSLNRLHKYPIIRFRGDGTGEGVCWGYIEVDALALPVDAAPKKKPSRPATLPMHAAAPTKKLRRAA